MKLAFKHYGNSTNPTIIIMHGLFGMLDNWQLHANKLSENFSVYSVDLRNHGRSPHSQEMNYELMASDIEIFCKKHSLDNIILLGHSMGGKVAMQFAVNYPQYLSKLLVADIAPKAYKPGHQVYIDAFNQIDFSRWETRKDADDAFAKFESNMGIRMFLLKNLEKAEKGYELKCNVPAIEKAYPIISEKIEIPYPIAVPTLFMKGEKSNYINQDDEAELQEMFPNSEIVTISKAGHWLHAENPEEFYSALIDFIGE